MNPTQQEQKPMDNKSNNGVGWFIAGIAGWTLLQVALFALAVTYIRAVFGSPVLGTWAAVAFAMNMHRPLDARFDEGSDLKFGIRVATVGIANITRITIAAWIVQASLHMNP